MGLNVLGVRTRFVLGQSLIHARAFSCYLRQLCNQDPSQLKILAVLSASESFFAPEVSVRNLAKRFPEPFAFRTLGDWHYCLGPNRIIS